jgi:hypothetical protein
MIATVSNNTTFEIKTANGFSSLFSAETAKTKLVNLTKSIEISFTDFEQTFTFEVINQVKRSKVLIFNVKLNGKTLIFTIDQNASQTKLGIEPQKYTPTSVFLTSTLHALMALSKTTRIKSNNFDFTVSQDFSINKISQFLQQRQLSHRLMVVERALNFSFIIPESVDVSNINYCYHSVVDRKFDWLCNTDAKVGFSETGNETKEIFGKVVDLGQQKFTLISYKIANVESITTPTLPKNAFSKDVQALIDLDEKLDSMVMEKYLNSFSNAFEGLTDEQIAAIAERPTLEEEAFSF